MLLAEKARLEQTEAEDKIRQEEKAAAQQQAEIERQAKNEAREAVKAKEAAAAKALEEDQLERKRAADVLLLQQRRDFLEAEAMAEHMRLQLVAEREAEARAEADQAMQDEESYRKETFEGLRPTLLSQISALPIDTIEENEEYQEEEKSESPMNRIGSLQMSPDTSPSTRVRKLFRYAIPVTMI